MSKSQDDPCKFIQAENRMDSCSLVDTIRVIDLLKIWRHKYNNEWQLLCFTPEQERETKYSILTCQLNSNINESFKRKKKSSLIEISISDETQILWIPDSLLSFNQDLFRGKVGVSKQYKSKTLSPMLSLNIETQKFKKFQLSIDSVGLSIKKLESAFLAPGIITLQSGIKISFKPGNELDLGIASAKYKLNSNKEVRLSSSQEADEIPSGKSKPLIDGGFAAIGAFESSLNKLVKLEQSCRFFYPISKPRSPEIEMRNKLSIKLAKHLKTSLLTIYSYSENRWPPSFWRAELRLGYFIDN